MGSDKTAVYRESMSRGHELARAGKWAEAAQAYRRAVGAVSSDVLSRTCLAQALYKSGNLGDAAREYEGVLKLSPRDLLVLIRVADIRRSLGALLPATEFYLRAAEVHLEEKRKDKALEVWQTIVETCGENLGCLERLAKACAKAGEKQLEAEALLGIARAYAEVADQKQAVKACRRAIDVDRSSNNAQLMLTSLEHGTNEWRALSYLERFKPGKLLPESTAGVAMPQADAETPSPAAAIQDDAQSARQSPVTTRHRDKADALMTEAHKFETAGDVVSAAAVLCSTLDAPDNDDVSVQAKRQLDVLLPGWQKLSCSELATLPFEDRRAALQRMLDVEEYARNRLSHAAMDACFAVIERSPGYLPAQVRLGDIYLADGNVEAAREKYSRIVQIYEMRNDTYRAKEASARLATLYAEDDSAGGQLVETLLGLGNSDLAIEQGLKAAERLNARGDARGSLDLLRKMAELTPNRVDINLRLATVADNFGLVAEAKDAYLRAWKADPSDDDVTLRLALASARVDTWSADEGYLARLFDLLIEDADFALIFFKRILGLGTDGTEKAELKLCLAASMRGQGKIEHARRMLLEVIGGGGFTDAMAHYLLASCLIDKGDSVGAIEQLRGDVHGLSAWLHLRYMRLLADAYRQLGDNANLLAVLEAIRKADSTDRNVSEEIVGLYFNASQDERALEELNRLAGQQITSSEREQTLQIYRDLVKRFPNNISIRKLLSSTCESLGLGAEAAQQLEFAVRLELARSQKPDALNDLRRIVELYGQPSPEKALAAREKLVELAPEDVAARLDLVDAYLRMGLPSKALLAADSLVRLLLEQTRHEEAIEALQRILGIEPWNRWALEQLGSSLASLGRHEDSRAVFRRLLSVDPRNEVARQHLTGLER